VLKHSCYDKLHMILKLNDCLLSLYICHGDGPLVDPFRSHLSRNIFPASFRETCQWLKISPEWVTGPEQGKSSGRIATVSLWTGMFRDGISSIPGETVIPCDSVVICYNICTSWILISDSRTVLKEHARCVPQESGEVYTQMFPHIEAVFLQRIC